jgi:phospholipid/cholesterol/gamma-HCH transport system substrate-binding protein
MLDRSRKFKVGLFVMGSSMIFVALLFLAIGTSFTKNLVRYTIQFEETVKGMVIGSSVNFQGVQVGSVVDMRFVGGRTEVMVETDPGKAPITEHCEASLDRAWVTGQVTVELSGWEKGASVLPQGALIRARLSPMSALGRTLPAMLDNLNATLEEYRLVAQNINALLGGENAAAIAGLLANAQQLVARFEELSGPLLGGLSGETLPRIHELLDKAVALEPDLRSLIAHFSSFGAKLDELGSQPALSEAIARAPRLVAAVEATSQSLGRSADELRHLLRGQGPGLAGALTALDSTLREVGALARMLRKAPSALVFGETQKERATTAPARPRR